VPASPISTTAARGSAGLQASAIDVDLARLPALCAAA
jgi:hypothetical protein